MKKLLMPVIALLLLCPFILLAQTGKVYDNLSLTSKILKSDRKFAVYLPPGYETSDRSYPILYLLHGAGDDQTGWIQFGEVLNITDKAIADGSATAMIIVMPDANTGRRGYFNDIKGDWNYEDFFFKELVPYVEKKYRVRSEKRYRAIAGLSMGGGGSFMYALHHPEMFSSACPLSAAVGPITLDDARKMYTRSNPTLADSVIVAYYNTHSAWAQITNMPDEQKKAVRWFMDVGDDDRLSEGNSLVHIAMQKKEIAHVFHIRDGAHNWTYWRASLPVVLEFISQGFHQY